MLSLLCACAGVMTSERVALPQDPAAAAPRFAIRAARVHVGDGSVIENGLVVIEGATIVAVGADPAAPEGVVVREHDADLAPGWIALHDQSGADGELVDATRTLMGDARIALAFDATHSDLPRLVSAGITSIVLASPDAELSAGQTAVVKTHGGRTLRDPAHLQLSFSSASLHFDRHPTSYAGAVAELDQRMSEGAPPYGLARSGELPVLLAASEKHEILRAIDFAKRHGVRGALYRAPLAGELAEHVRASGLAVVWRPFDPGVARRELDSLVALARAGVPFGFALDAPERHPDSLRVAAAAGIRQGVERDVALRALTSTAATIAGVGDRVGRIAAGLDADLVLWSGDPLDLTSSIRAVYVGGELVHGGNE
jgi:imidazolonepropionase-like amidohydrolase